MVVMMRIRRTILLLFAGIAPFTFSVDHSRAQSPAQSKATPKSATPVSARPVAPQKVEATLAQLMKGILYPASNIIFAAQDKNPAEVPPAQDPSTSVNPLSSSYGGWQAVENAALAMAEGANLLVLPGRKCSNGFPAPINNADWPKLVDGLREAAMVTYKAAQSKNQDQILDAADKLTSACASCHDKYREKPNLADRCK
jgi:hypothetical protein